MYELLNTILEFNIKMFNRIEITWKYGIIEEYVEENIRKYVESVCCYLSYV